MLKSEYTLQKHVNLCIPHGSNTSAEAQSRCELLTAINKLAGGMPAVSWLMRCLHLHKDANPDMFGL